MFDIIGDIHGHADELIALLKKLGYQMQSGVFAHPERKAVFCGDFVDRGPDIPKVVEIVRTMVEHNAAFAVMGNHEFNALAFHTQHPERPGEWLRPHSARNVDQHKATLDQFSDADLQAALDWFRTLPVAIEFEDFRVVHACWSAADIELINECQQQLGDFNAEFLLEATTIGRPLFDAIECVLKGPELPLPDGLTVADKEGHLRKRIRIRWFESAKEKTWANYSLPVKPQLPNTLVPPTAPARPYSPEDRPVFVGHYWLPDDELIPLTANVACLDFSVARGGSLGAYRFDGGRGPLQPQNFVAVPASQ